MSHKNTTKKKSRIVSGPVAAAGKETDSLRPLTPASGKSGGRRSLKKKGPAPLVLEQRFMFDAAAVATAADVVDKTQAATPQVVPQLPDTLASVAQLIEAGAAASSDAKSAAGTDAPATATGTAPAAAAAPASDAHTATAATDSKDVVATDAKTVVDDANAKAQAAQPDPIAEIEKAIQESPDQAAQLQAHTEIVFIDASVQDYQQLINEVRPGIGVVLLDPTKDVWSQITSALQTAGKVSGIHILSHGMEAGMILNGQTVTQDTLNLEAGEIAKWSQYMTADADILLYGCDVAQGSDGQAFVRQFAQLSGANVAASTDATGDASRGGNWVLEDKTGEIETKTLAFDDYSHLLTVTYSTTTPSVGTVLTFTTDAKGLGTPTYQWFRNASGSNTGGTAIAGATGASYTVTANDAGQFLYVVIYKNGTSVGDTGNAIQVVNAAPVVDLNGATTGTNNSVTFTEMGGADTGANAVFFTSAGSALSDADGSLLANLRVSISSSSVGSGDQLLLGSTVIDITGTSASGEVTYNGTVFGYAIADSAGTRTITFTSKTGAGGSASTAAIASYEALIEALKFNNTSDTPSGTRTFSVTANDGSTNNSTSAAATFTVTVNGVNDAPVLADTNLVLNTMASGAAPSGAVGSLVSALTGGVSDRDGSGVAQGIAIVGVDETQGTWWYSTNGGSTWTAVSAGGALSGSNALLLAANASTRLYFQASSTDPGAVQGALTLRAWDTTSGSAGSKVAISSTGGSSAFSDATDTVAVSIKPSYSLSSSDALFYDLQSGNKYDPSSDTQANSSDLDLVGNANYPLLQGAYDSINGDLYYRVRIGNPTLKGGVPQFGAVMLLGLDVNGDGKVDIYIGVDGRNNGLGVVTFAPGSGANTGPSTTSLSNPQATTSGSFEYKLASSYGAAGDLNSDGKADAYLTFKLDFASLAARVQSLTGVALTPSSNLGMVLMTMTQNNSINGDIGGIGALTNAQKSMTWNQLGLMQQVNFTKPSIDVSGTYVYTENAAGINLAGSSTLIDLDSYNYSGGKLTASITGNYSSGDILGFNGGNVTFTGSTSGNVLVGGTQVGTYSYSAGTLTVNFTALSVSQAQVQSVLRAVSYSSSSDAPSTANRTVSFSITDPEGNAGDARTATVVVQAVDDAPTISGSSSAMNGAATTENLNTAATTSALIMKASTSTGLSIADVDAGSNSVTVTLSVDKGTLELYSGSTQQTATSFTVGGVIIKGYGTSSITMVGTITAINSLLAGTTTTQILYQAGNNTGSATVTMTVNDNGNSGSGGPLATSQTVGTITISGTPSITGTTTGAVQEDLTGTASGSLTAGGGVTFNAATFVGNTAGTTALGALSMGSGGSWTYTLSNSNATVQALAAGQSIVETYKVTTSNSKTLFITVTINGTNDAPTLTVTNTSGGFTENSSAINLFSGATATFGAGETGQAFTQLGVSVTNVFDGDQLTIDGTSIYIDSSSSNTVTTNGYTVNVSLSGGTATVTVVTAGIDATTLQNLITGMKYGSISDNPTNYGNATSRTITLSTLKDNGGSANGGSDTWSTGASRTVAITASNDGPTLITAPALVYPSTSLTINTDYLTSYDPDTLAANLTYTITSAISNGTLYKNGVALANGGSFTQADVVAGLITFTPNTVGSDTAVSIGLSVSDGSTASTGTLGLTLLASAPDVSVSDVTVSEGSPYVMFKVSINGNTSASMSFTPTLISGTATVGVDTGSSLEWWNGSAWVATPVTVAAGSGVRTVLVRAAIVNDSTAEGSENFLFSTGTFSGTDIRNQSGASAVGTIVDDGSSTNVFLANNTSGTATVGTADDDRGLSVSSVTVSEASPYAVFAVSGNAGQVVSLALQSGTATVGTDTGSSLEYFNGSSWVAVSGNVTMASTTLLVRVAVNQDSTYEGSETFTLKATNVGGTAFSGTGAIVDDGSISNVFLGNNNSATPTSGTADNDIPGASITAINDDAGSITGVVANGGRTDDTTPGLSGTLTSALSGNLVLAVYRNGVKVGNASVSGTTWSYADSGVSDGNQYTYTVRVEDSTSSAHGSTSTGYAITIDTTAPGSATGTLTVAENAANGTAVGTVSATDASTVTYSLVDTAGGRFALSGNQITVANGALLDYESATSHSITVRATDAAGNVTDTVMTVAITNVDEAPTLSATTSTPTYTEDGSAVSLFSAAAASLVDANQTVKRLDFTVSNVSNGTAEVMTVDGTAIALVAGSGTTATNGLSYTVTISSGVATISLTKGAGISSSALQSLVNGMRYQNTSQDPTAGNRVVTLTRLDDSGSNTAPNVNTTNLNIASTVTVVAVNDAAVIGGTTSASLTETDAAQSTGGTLTISDVDSPASFQAQTNAAGSNGYGKFSIDSAGVWSYTMNSAHDEFVAGQTYTDSITVYSADGTPQVLSVTITGTNDAAVIGTPTVTDVTEDSGVSGGNLVASGTISISDKDSGEGVFSTTVTGSSGNLGSLSLAADGSYTYSVANSATQYLGASDTKVDTFTITSADGTSKQISFTIHGQNDAAVIGTPTVADVTEDTDVASGNLVASGSISISDADQNQSSFSTTVTSGSGNLGSLTLAANGSYSYSVSNSATQYLGAGETKVDTFTITAADGTSKQISFTIHGQNDAAVIGTPTVADVTEDTNVAGGNLVASGSISISDADQSQSVFSTTVTGSAGNLGSLSLAADGSYSYSVANSATQYLGAGDTKVDTFTITSADGSSKDISFTIHGKNDAAVIGTPTVADVTEDTDITGGNLVASGSISISDPDQNQSVFSTTVTGSAGNLGSLSLAADGSYSYSVANSATQYLGAGETKVDTFTITAADGSSKQISFTIHGQNDAAVIGTPTVADVTEDTDVASGDLVASGSISISDTDQNQSTLSTTVTSADGNLGSLSLAADGSYSYSVANSATQYLGAGDTKVDTFTITSADGTSKQISFTIHGKNDAAVIGTPTVTDVTEDTDVASGNLVASGSISISDADQNQSVFSTTVTGSSGNLGSLSLASDGSYSYSVANSATQYLGEGETKVDTFTITSADGSSKQISFTIHGQNDAAVIGTPTVADVTEDTDLSDGNLTASGSIPISDADQNQSTLSTTVAGSSGNLGSLVLAADGSYTYSVANSATQYLGAGETRVDTFTISSADGTSKQISFTIHGKNDAAVIGEPTVADVMEDTDVLDGNLIASGSISISDVDQNQSSFSTTVTGSEGNLGSLTLASDGSYTYSVANSATQNLSSGDTKVDTFTITSADGTSKQISFTIHGQNHAAVIGTPTVADVTEDTDVSDGNLVASGSISISDVDQGQSSFSTTVTGSNGNLGSLVLAADGSYSYSVANSATQYLAAGETKVDTFTITSADGTSKDISFTIHGKNDAAVIGTPTVTDVTEDTDVSGGSLIASGSISISDADQNQSSFSTTVTSANGNLGSLTLASDGSYSYSVTNSATQYLGAGETRVDTFTITSADGTSKDISFTIHGKNDAAVIGAPTVTDVTEDTDVSDGNLIASGSISISDVDQNQGNFSTTVTSSDGNLGSLTLAADGSYSYSVANSATQYLGAGETKVDTFTITAADGTSKQISFTIHGKNDAAVIGTPTVADVTEDTDVAGGNLVASGSISISDADQNQSTLSTTVTGSDGNLGSLTLASDGSYTYSVANSATQYLGAGETKVDTFTITSADGTSKDISFTIHGKNDAAVIGTPTVADVTEDTDVSDGSLVASGSISISDTDQNQSTLSTTVTSADGNLGSLSLAADGSYSYSVANSATQYLGAGETKVDTFTITSADGTSKQISFTIHGKNDAAVIGTPTVTDVTEDTDVSGGSLVASGSISISDDDQNQSVFSTTVTGSNGNLGSLTLASDGSYSYSVANSATQYLGAGETKVDTFTITSADGTSKDISFTIHGKNDAAVIGTPTVTDVTEDTDVSDGSLVASGSISISDVDQNQSTLSTTVTGADGNLGSLTLAADGSYTYSVANSATQYLGAGDTKVDTFTITAADGTSKQISFTIHGKNDAAVIGTPTVTDVTEDTGVSDGNLVASGSISISDVDQNQSTLSTTVTSADGNLGSLTLAADGSYSYSVANSATQYLGAGETKVDTFTITSADGTSKDISFTIHGKNDAAVIGTPTVADVTEDTDAASGNLVASGSISIFDADQNQGNFNTTVTGSNGNLGSLTLASDGSYSYSVANSATQYLGAGETKVDTFTITSADGTSKDISFTIHGKNDAAVIGTPTVTDVTEDTDVSGGTLVASGSISISDADQNQSTLSTTVTSADGNLGSLTLAADGTYSYSVANSATQYLGAGETKVDTFTITAADGTSKQISFTIHGKNDVAVIGTPTVTDVTEDTDVSDGSLVASGSISISDVDQNQSTLSTTVTSADGNLGSLTLAADGSYSYSVANSATQYLGAGETKVDTFTITSADGTSKDISFTIHGKNDAAVIGTPTIADVTEDTDVTGGNLVASGSISISDVDQNQSTLSTTVTSADGNLGSLTLAADGSYSYSVANSATQYLGAGETKVDTFTITSADGTSKQISFTIHGKNDAAVIGEPTVTDVTEDTDVSDGSLVASGSISISDVDQNQSTLSTTVTGADGNLGSLTLASDGSYSYSVANSVTQYLGAGETKVDTFTITSADGTSKQISFTIHGKNDAAVIGTPTVTDVTEDTDVSDGNLVASGSISVSDADQNQGNFSTTVTSSDGNLGGLILAADGTYSYSVANSATQYLGAGETKVDTFTITSTDGTSKQISFTIHGKNDAAVIGTPTVTDVTEDTDVSDGSLVASGSISISDVDQNQSRLSTTVSGSDGNLGSLILAADGTYSYSVANSATQYLGAGETKVDTFTITSADGTSKQISFTIHGKNDAAVIGTPTVADVTEDTDVSGGSLVASGSISISDADQNQSVFNTTVTGSNGNLGSLTLASDGSYTYSVANSATQYLGVGETKVDTFTITSADGTSKQISFTIHGKNDAAVIGTPTVADVTEDTDVSDGSLVASGSISISDVDQSQSTLSTTVTSANGNLGSLTLAADGSYSYSVANSATQYLGAGETRVDTFTITSADGTSKDVSFTIHGKNDVAVIGTPTVTDVTEDTDVSDGSLVASGSISISDVDQNQSTLSTTVTSADGNLGSLTLAADGSYSYSVANSATQYLGAGETKVDTFTITSADGTSKDISFTIHGKNDAAVIGTPTVADVTEDTDVTGGNLVASGSISISDVDQSQSTLSTTVTSADGNLGSLTLAADGSYSYSVANSATQYLGAGETKVDTFTITSADGTSKDISFTIHGKNDAAVIGTPTVADVTEDTDVTGGNLVASGWISISDADQNQSSLSTTVTGSDGNLGSLVLAADGSYSYSVANSATQYLGAGETKVDTFTITAADGTSKQISFTIHGKNDAAVIGEPTVTDVTEDTDVSDGILVASGSISISDVDQNQSTLSTTVSGSDGNLGSLTLAADGSYSYSVANSATQYLGAGETKVDTFTITSSDGTSKQISFTIHGKNDAAVIGTPTVTDVSEDTDVSDGNLVASGSISISDADQNQGNFSTTVTSSDGNLGSLILAADGTYSYSVANNATQYLGAGETKVDTFTITSADGTSKQISFTIHGKNDAAVIGTPTVANVTEDTDVSDGSLVASGSISISDVDQNQSNFSTTVTSSDGNLGSLTLAADGSYSYSVANSATQYLGAGETKVDTFTITSSDGTSKQISFTIHGKNDAAVIGTPTVANVTEDSNVSDGSLIASGSISISDADQNQSTLSTTVTSADGNLGSLTLAADGSYTYSVANSATQYLGAGDTKVDTFTITAADGTSKQISFTIHGKNDAAVIGTPTVTDVTEDTDVSDGTLIASGSISISDADQNQGSLSTTVTGSDGNLGTLTLSSDGSYTYAVANSATQYLGAGETKVDTFTITSADGTSKEINFTIHGKNDAAVIGEPTVTDVTEDTDVASGNLVASGSISISDADQNQGSFSTTVSGSDGNLGSLTLAADGSYSYSVANSATQYLGAGETKVDTFTITAADGSSKEISFTIHGRNDAAVIGTPTVTDVTEDTGVSDGNLVASGSISISDVDQNQSTLSTTVTSSDGNLGSLTLAADGTYSYSVANSATQYLGAGETKVDTFTITSADGTSKEISFTIHGKNDAAVIGTPTVADVTEDADVNDGNLVASGSISISDVDQNQGSLSTTVTSNDGNLGTLTLSSDGSYSYSVANSATQYLGAGETKLDTFTITSADGTSKQISFTIHGKNDAAVIGTPTVADVTEDTDVSGGSLVASGSISISDADQNQSVFNTTVSGSNGNLGSLTLAADGSYSYSVANSATQYLGAGETKVDTFTITSSDGTTKQISFTIRGKNDAAVIGTPTVTDVTEDTDVSDGNLIASGSISISDADQNQSTLSTTVTSSDGNLGSLILAADGTYSYSVANSATQYLGAGETKVDTFTITAADGTSKQISFTIHGKNDAAVIGTPTVVDVTEDTDVIDGTLIASGSISISDADQNQGNFSTTVTGSNGNLGSLSLASDGSYSYSVANSATQYLGAGETKVDTFTITSADGTSKQISFTIHGKNDAAVIGTPTVANVTEDTDVSDGNLIASGSISISDADQNQGNFSTTVTSSQGTLGSLVLAADGSYTYSVSNEAVQSLGAGQTKVESFTVTTLDGSSKTISFSIHGVNDAAQASDDSYALNADTTLIVPVGSSVLANDSDVDNGDHLSARVIDAPAHGTLTLNADGSFTYTPEAGYFGSDSFTYVANDGTIDSAKATVNLTVHGVAKPGISLANDSGSNTSDGRTNDPTVNFSTAADGVTRSYSINGGDPSSSWTAPTADGTYTVVVTDRDDYGNSKTTSFTYTLDRSAPAVTVTSASAVLRAGETTLLTLTFSEAPIGFDLSDLSLPDGKGALANLQQVSGKVYTVLYTPVANQAASDVTITLGNQSYEDLAGNKGQGGGVTVNVNTAVTVKTGTSPAVIVMDEDSTASVSKQDLALSITNSAGAALNLPDSSIWVVIDSSASLGSLVLNDGHGNLTPVAAGARIRLDQIGTLQFTPRPDEYAVRYDKLSYHLEYTAEGGTSRSATQDLVFSVRNVNDAPVGKPIVPVSLPQGATYSIDLSSVFTDADPDDRGKLVFSVSSAAGVTASINGNILTVVNIGGAANAPLQLTITARDRAGATGTTLLDLTLRGPSTVANVAPTLDAPTSVQMPESKKAGDVVFTVTGSDTPADNIDGQDEVLSYTLTGADASRFSIDANGRVTLVKALDFEKPSDIGGVAAGDNIYSFTVNVSDGRGGVASKTVSVEVTNVVEGAQPSDGGDGTIQIPVQPGGSSQVDLSKIYVNPEGGAPISFQVALNGQFGNNLTDGSGVTVTLSGSVLQVSAPANFSGFFDITVRTTVVNSGQTIVTDYTAHIVRDLDTDGVDDFTELFAGDLNHDGITDDKQSDVASFPTVSSDPSDPSSYMALVATKDANPIINDQVAAMNTALLAALQSVFGNSQAEQDLLATITSALRIEGVGVGGVSAALGQKILTDIGSSTAAANQTLQQLDAPLGLLQFTLKPEVVETAQQLLDLKQANQQAYDAYMNFKQAYETNLQQQFSVTQQVVKVILPAGTLINSYLKPVFETDANGNFVTDSSNNKIILRYEDYTQQTVTVNGQQLLTGAKYFDAQGNEIVNIKSLTSEQLKAANLSYVELYFVDNQRGDDDRAVGSIVDPGIFALVQATNNPEQLPTTHVSNPNPVPVQGPVIFDPAQAPVLYRVDIDIQRADLSHADIIFNSQLRQSEIAYSTESGFENHAGSLQRSFGEFGDRHDSSDARYTLDFGWKAMVFASDDANLSVFRGMGDQFVEKSTVGSFTVPADAFVHTKADAWVELHATLVDGSPLPNWVQFDSRAGVFKFAAPKDFQGELKIKLTARDNAGREARTMFRFQVGEPQAKIGGRPSFSEQLKGAARAARMELSKSDVSKAAAKSGRNSV